MRPVLLVPNLSLKLLANVPAPYCEISVCHWLPEWAVLSKKFRGSSQSIQKNDELVQTDYVKQFNSHKHRTISHVTLHSIALDTSKWTLQLSGRLIKNRTRPLEANKITAVTGKWAVPEDLNFTLAHRQCLVTLLGEKVSNFLKLRVCTRANTLGVHFSSFVQCKTVTFTCTHVRMFISLFSNLTFHSTVKQAFLCLCAFGKISLSAITGKALPVNC
jgi:hypothetical protein